VAIRQPIRQGVGKSHLMIADFLDYTLKSLPGQLLLTGNYLKYVIKRTICFKQAVR
jgi:hypothetical protein